MHVEQVRDRRALVAADVGHARLQQRLGDREDALAVEGLAGAPGAALWTSLLERDFQAASGRDRASSASANLAAGVPFVHVMDARSIMHTVNVDAEPRRARPQPAAHVPRRVPRRQRDPRGRARSAYRSRRSARRWPGCAGCCTIRCSCARGARDGAHPARADAARQRGRAGAGGHRRRAAIGRTLRARPVRAARFACT